MNEFLLHKCDRGRLGHIVFTEPPNVPHSRTYFFSCSLSHLTFHLPSHFRPVWPLSFSSDPFISNFVHKSLHIRRSPRWMINHWGLSGSDMVDLQIAAWKTAHIRTGEEGRRGLVNSHRSAFPTMTGTPGKAHTGTRTSDTMAPLGGLDMYLCVCVCECNKRGCNSGQWPFRDAQIGSEVRPPETPGQGEVVCFPASRWDFNPGFYCNSSRFPAMLSALTLARLFLTAAGPKGSCPSF